MLHLTLEDCLSFLEPDETLGDLLRRACAEKLFTGVDVIDEVSLRPGMILEVAGLSTSGKTQFLAVVAAQCLARGIASQRPQQQPGLGGAAPGPASSSSSHASVVWVDTEGKLDNIRILRVVQEVVHAALPGLVAAAAGAPLPTPHCGAASSVDQAMSPQQASAALAEAVHSARSRLYIVRPASGAQVLAVMLQLRRTMAQCAAANAPVRLLLVDGATSTNWQLQGAGGPTQQPPGAPLYPALTSHRVCGALAAGLKRLAVEFRCCVIAARHATMQRGDQQQARGSGSSSYRAHVPQVAGQPLLRIRDMLPMTWSKAVTHRLVLAPARFVQNPEGKQGTRLKAQMWQGTTQPGAVRELVLTEGRLVAV